MLGDFHEVASDNDFEELTKKNWRGTQDIKLNVLQTLDLVQPLVVETNVSSVRLDQLSMLAFVTHII